MPTQSYLFLVTVTAPSNPLALNTFEEWVSGINPSDALCILAIRKANQGHNLHAIKLLRCAG